jgi:hypothetical protein
LHYGTVLGLFSSISQFGGKGHNLVVAERVYYLTAKSKTGDAIPLTTMQTRKAQNIDKEGIHGNSLFISI